MRRSNLWHCGWVLALGWLTACVAGERRSRADVYARLPHGPGFRNVRDCGAKGDGITDDTQAFVRALEQGRSHRGHKAPANVYVPPGTYLVSDSLIVWRATLLAGDADDPPTLVLKDHAPGFDDPAHPKPVLVTAGGYNVDPAARDWRTRNDQLGGSTNNTFFITLRHLKIKIGEGNPGAWGIYWLVAQQTALRHVTVDAGSAQGCLKSIWWGGGGVISHVHLVGGDYGWYVDQTSQWVLRSARLERQRKHSMWLGHVWNFSLLDLQLRDTAPMATQGGAVTLVDSSFENIAGGAAIQSAGTSLVLQNVVSRGNREVVRDTLSANPQGETRIAFWACGTAMLDGRELPGKVHDLGQSFLNAAARMPSPDYPVMTASVRSVTEFGAKGDGKTDDTLALRRAIDAVDELFVPEGTYRISGSLRLRPRTRLFGEMWSRIVLASDSPGFDDPASHDPMIEIPASPNAAVTVCHLQLRMQTAGGIYCDWRAGQRSMLIDTSFANDNRTQTLNWRISGGGFFENLWNPGASGDGLEITSTGRTWLYSVQQEHYPGTALILRGAKHVRALGLQFETSSRYVLMDRCEDVGLSWDGRGKAAVGFDHAAQKRFETEVCHEHEAFRNFTENGIRVGHRQKVASAEILYHNCLFENCGTALAFLTFNDYDNTIDGCEFRDCGTGVLDNKGNFYARNCHFEGSRRADFVVGSEHGSSIRRATSVGSRRFIEEVGTVAPLTVEDCHVAGWTDPEGAVYLNGSPVLLFDCSFSRPPSDRPPVKLVNPAQKLVLSNNRPTTVESLVQTTLAAKLYVVPSGRLGGVVTSAQQRFLRDSAAVPGKVFDAVADFGAKGDGRSDDTAAIQAAIDAARKAGHGAIAYLPTGRYVVSKTLLVTGGDYTLGGSGFRCGLVWRGETGLSLVEVDGAQNVTLANLAVGNHDFGPMTHGDDIRVTSAPGTPCRLTLDGVYGFGMYQKAPDKHGLHFDRLPPGSVVDARHVQGNLRITGSDRALLLFRTSYEGTVTIEGPAASREGIVGFLTRLATQSKPTLRVRDNRSLVMSDFYNEQSDQHLVFEGAAGQPEGAVTIQGAKMHMFSQEPVMDIRNYAGRIYYGQSQFYQEPKEPRFVSHGSRPVRLILAGHFWYGTKPRFELGPEVKLTLVANREVPDVGVDGAAMKAMAAALDDLRRLGELDRRLSRSAH